jgi:hypothetical protein
LKEELARVREELARAFERRAAVVDRIARAVRGVHVLSDARDAPDERDRARRAGGIVRGPQDAPAGGRLLLAHEEASLVGAQPEQEARIIGSGADAKRHG